MNIKIEKGIPIPKHIGIGCKSYITEAFDKMKVGDSFLVDKKTKSVSNFYLYAKVRRLKIVIRTMPDGRKRLWRIE